MEKHCSIEMRKIMKLRWEVRAAGAELGQPGGRSPLPAREEQVAEEGGSHGLAALVKGVAFYPVE